MSRVRLLSGAQEYFSARVCVNRLMSSKQITNGSFVILSVMLAVIISINRSSSVLSQ